MTKQHFILFFLIFNSTLSFACLNAYQFKIFPVGVLNDTIITIDFKISRTSEFEGKKQLNLEEGNTRESTEMWILYCYLSSYDKNQKLLSTTPLDTTYSLESYADTLQGAFNRGIEKIKNDFNSIDYFIPSYISFCDFQRKCKLVEIKTDSITDKDFIIYENSNYEIISLSDSAHFNNNESPYYVEDLEGYYINSVRVFKSKKLTLVISHLTTGHEILMGYITNDPDKATVNSGGNITLSKEYTPKIEFSDIHKTTYEEPILHHGYGFDLFIVK